MNKLSNRTKQLLRLTRASLRAEACAYNQGMWGGGDSKELYPSCGAAACLIGWMVFHAIKRLKAQEKRRKWRVYLRVARKHGASGYFRSPWVEKLLGLSNAQVNNLYWKDNWPYDYKYTDDEDAENAAKRITHFIDAEGDESTA